MEKKKILTFLDCFCCSKTFNIESLIEMNTNSLIIGSETIDFCDLILEVCLTKMDTTQDAFICEACKDSLVHFHIFKKNIKQYKSFKENVQSCEMFLKLEPLLPGFETDKVLIEKYNEDEILIAPATSHEKYKNYIHTQPREALLDEVEDTAVEPLKNSNRKRKRTKTSNDCVTLEIHEHETSELKIEMQSSESILVEEKIHIPKVAKSSASRWNTNSGLTEEQKSWINEKAKDSEVKEGARILWKCSVCESKMSSSWVLRKHLRDVHVIKESKSDAGDKKRGKNFMDEVRSCKVQRLLENGDEESNWKCKRCDNVLKSESGFIKHLLYTHIKSNCVDPSFIAKCKIQIEYETDGPPEDGWACPECKKMYRTAVGLRNHFKLEHPEIDFGGEKYQKKLNDVSERSMKLKQEEKQSEIVLETESGPRKIWQCHRCREARYFRSERGFKAHVRNLHLQTKIIDEHKIAKCKTVIQKSGSKQRVWKCSLCATVTKTKEGFVSHVTHEHPGEFDDGFKDIEEVDSDLGSRLAKDQTVLEKLTEQVTNERSRSINIKGYKFACNECGLFFSKHYPTHVDAHKTLSQLVSRYRLPKCEQCHVILSTDNAMQIHIQSHDNESGMINAQPSKGLAYYGGKQFKEPTGSADDAVDDNTWKCGHCFAMFWDENECVLHQMLLHSESLVCPFDNLSFTGNRGLALFCSHMKNKHPELFPDLTFPCTYCQKDYPTILDKLAHMKHCAEKNLECDGCGKKFFSKIKLAHHLKIETGLLTYECNVCGKKCTNSMDLKLHIVGTHTDDRLYQCTFQDCFKAFKTSASRSSHMEIHSDVSLNCPFCGGVFKKRVVLARHIKMMHDETYRKECFDEFKCQLCSKSFLRKNNFKNHLKSVHNIIEEDLED